MSSHNLTSRQGIRVFYFTPKNCIIHQNLKGDIKMVVEQGIVEKIMRGEFAINRFSMEIDQECNFVCKDYCYHGFGKERMKRNMMDTIFAVYKKSPVKIGSLHATGGEHLYKTEPLSDLRDSLRNSGLSFNDFGITTNASDVKPEVIEIISDIASMSESGNSTITVSNTSPHLANFERLGLDFGQQCDALRAMAKNCRDIKIEIQPYQDITQIRLINAGYAKKLTGANYYPKSTGLKFSHHHRLGLGQFTQKQDLLALWGITFDVNGNVVPTTDYGDKSRYGNILHDNMTDVYIKHGVYKEEL